MIVTGIVIEDGAALITLEGPARVVQVAVPVAELAGLTTAQAAALVRERLRATVTPPVLPTPSPALAALVGREIAP